MSSPEAPVFVIGCPRSGTTLLYHMLVSGGAFANYRAETHLFDEILPAVGPLHRRRSRERLLARWLASPRFAASGLDARDFAARVRAECRSAGDFLRLFLGAVARAQGVRRWAECTPAHALHLRDIRQAVPHAQFVHIIRDGRDVALSLARLGWVRPLPWDRARPVEVAAWTWEWHVHRARAAAASLGAAYCEVRYEALVEQPATVLRELGGFLGERLELERIRAAGVGSVSRPNTAFGSDAASPVGRWRHLLDEDQLAAVEAGIGRTLDGLGYETGTRPRHRPGRRARKGLYVAYRATRLALKTRTPLGRAFTQAAWDTL